MNFILFNGPPRSGKDTAAKIAFDYISSNIRYLAVWEKFSFPNKRAFAGMVNLMCDEWGNVQPFEDRKGEVWPTLGVSYRQWQIDFSEKYMKPLYGNDIFGRLLLNRCHAIDEELKGGFTPIFIVSDCGFQIEVDTLKEHRVLLIQMWREGCTFDGDSREWVGGHDGWSVHHINNDFSKESLRQEVTHRVEGWLP